MEVLDKIRQELERGFTKRELEVLMGIPKNNLSGILKQQKKISAKGLIRINKYFDLEVKPMPSEKIERAKQVNLSPSKPKDNKTQGKEEKQAKNGTEKPNNDIQVKVPTNLAELKAMCPFKEFGEERSVWISDNRQKYNI